MDVKTNMSALPASQRSLVYAGLIGAAIANEALVEFDYDGKRRVVEAHAIGKSTKDESIVFRGYQIDGEASRPLPQWTLFSVDKIEVLKLHEFGTSRAPRDGYVMGDKQMLPVLAEIDLG